MVSSPAVLLDSSLIWESVGRLTGWSSNPMIPRVEYVSGKRLEERVAFDEFRRTGVPAQPRKGRQLYTSYLRTEHATLCNSDLLTQDSMEEARTSLFLAFVRAAQCHRYPDFFGSTDLLSREARLMGCHGGDVPVDERVRRCLVAQDKLQARLSFVEGHAAALYAGYAQQEGLTSRLLESSVKACLYLCEGSVSRIAQFLSGVLVVNEVLSRDPEVIETLYSKPALVEQVFGAARISTPEQGRGIVDSIYPAV